VYAKEVAGLSAGVEQLAPRYDAAAVEGRIYARWLGSGAFAPPLEPAAGARRFVITMPPPNVTGALHIGHALTFTVEDILVRYHRMRGDDTLWVPGVDHASIGAQFVLDRILAEEGETRASLGRERYLARMWRFMDETRDVIGQQLQRLGASADWSRNRFTMDPVSARAVRTAFRRLWDAGLAYRGEALVNWCPRCRTTVSDLENVHREEAGTLWTIRYHLAGPDAGPDPERWISIATTRPETLLGDTAIAVHPDDDRHRALIGQQVLLPFLGKRLPIIADAAVDPAFGTGAVKITPAHDPNDYATGRRHGLEMVSVFDEEARVNDAGGPFAGLDRYEARRRILDALRQAGDLEAERPHEMVVGHCERCGTVIEPRLSVQWFVRTRPLAERALASVREGRTRIVPARFEKVYRHWMENILDWAVGRQLWWGHRIPAWYCPDGHITVSDDEAGPSACAECRLPATELRQERDIFDTWFSSALWPFSTLGWPESTPDLARFYPTTLMETGYDILFFWVARMMMMGLFCTDAEPFSTVYLHGLVRAGGGVKMSKTKGNALDPLEVIDEIGADALRLALIIGTSPGSDQRLTQAKLDGGRNFANKLWNVARFVLGARPEALELGGAAPTLAERWIRSRLADVTERATRQFEELDLAGYAATIQEFAWSDYCDWFVEMAKVDLRGGGSAADRARAWVALADVLADLLHLLHPLMPFITEAIWEALGTARDDPGRSSLLMSAAWPTAGERDRAAEAEYAASAELVRAIRNLRTELGAPAGAWLPLEVVPAGADDRERIVRSLRYIEPLARVRPIRVAEPDDAHARPAALAATPGATAWFAEVAGGEETLAGRDRQRSELDTAISRVANLLANEDFRSRAPAAVVAREEARLADLQHRRRQLAPSDEAQSGYGAPARGDL